MSPSHLQLHVFSVKAGSGAWMRQRLNEWMFFFFFLIFEGTTMPYTEVINDWKQEKPPTEYMSIAHLDFVIDITLFFYFSLFVCLYIYSWWKSMNGALKPAWGHLMSSFLDSMLKQNSRPTFYVVWRYYYIPHSIFILWQPFRSDLQWNRYLTPLLKITEQNVGEAWLHTRFSC